MNKISRACMSILNISYNFRIHYYHNHFINTYLYTSRNAKILFKNLKTNMK